MARRFRFRLETVQKVRERARSAQRNVVAEKVQALGVAQGRVAELVRALGDDTHRSRTALLERNLDLVSLRRHERFRGQVRDRVARAHAVARERRDELKLEQVRLADASKRLRVIEKLRERQWNVHLAEVAREQQALSDEAAMQIHLRRRRNVGAEVKA